MRALPLGVGALLALIGLSAVARILWAGLPLLPATWHADQDVIWRTLEMCLSALLLSLGLGGGLALLNRAARLPYGADLLVSSAYFIPPFIGATAWLAALGPNNVLTGRALLNLYSPTGIVLVWTMHFAPLACLLLRSALSAQGDSLHLAGRIHGLSAGRVFRSVTWPLLRPALWSAALLIGLSLLGNFGVPAVLGFSEKIYTLATLSYARFLNPTLAQPLGSAAAVAWLLLLCSLPLLLTPAPKPYAGGAPLPLSAPAHLRFLAWGLTWLWFALSFTLPLLAVALLALKPAYSSGWTIEHFRDTLGLSTVQRGLWHSVLLASNGGAVRRFGPPDCPRARPRRLHHHAAFGAALRAARHPNRAGADCTVRQHAALRYAGPLALGLRAALFNPRH